MILAYHGVAFVVVLGVVIAAFADGAIGFAAVAGLLALQFIYSISFLELWSLAQGSYSLQMLMQVSQQGSMTRDDVVDACETIGAEKKRHRLDNLLTFGLATKSADGHIELSTIGAVVANLLRIIMRFTAIREAG
jgi:hypothetical protein